jgi:hypothetical protein
MNRGAGAAWREPGDRGRLLGIVAAIVLLALVAILAFVGGSGDDDGVDSPARAAQLVGVDDLTDLEGDLGRPIFWAGPRAPAELELSVDANGNAFVRYLPPGTEAGDPSAAFLTVGTYPVADAVASLGTAASEGDGDLVRAPDGVALANPDAQGSVYYATNGSDQQVEVYDPAPGRALELIRSGAIRPVGEG